MLSFSTSADRSPDIRGFIFGDRMRQNLLTRWLTHPSNPAFSDLRVVRIDGRFKSDLIPGFLAESAAPAEGLGGCRIRVDAMNASGAPPGKSSGRAPKGTGSTVPGRQPRQKASVSTPPPALLPPPPAAGRGCFSIKSPWVAVRRLRRSWRRRRWTIGRRCLVGRCLQPAVHSLTDSHSAPNEEYPEYNPKECGSKLRVTE